MAHKPLRFNVIDILIVGMVLFCQQIGPSRVWIKSKWTSPKRKTSLFLLEQFVLLIHLWKHPALLPLAIPIPANPLLRSEYVNQLAITVLGSILAQLFRNVKHHRFSFQSFFFFFFFCSGPHKLTLRARVNSSLLWSDGTGYREAAACITWTFPSQTLWTNWVQTVAWRSPVSPVPLPEHLAAGQPMAKELWTDRCLQIRWPGRFAVELQTDRRWPSITLRRNRRSPTMFPKSSSNITRQQCVCVETKHKPPPSLPTPSLIYSLALGIKFSEGSFVF